MYIIVLISECRNDVILKIQTYLHFKSENWAWPENPEHE